VRVEEKLIVVVLVTEDHPTDIYLDYVRGETMHALDPYVKKAIADDETGFRGKDDLPYRTEAWDFLLAGGAAYSNLDYSFSCAHPRGTAKVTTSPGGGGQ